jgi:prolipoprotein diacylglyceryltransferase
MFAAMPILPPIHGPRAAFADLAAFLRQRSREQVIGATLAILVTIIILILFFVDSKINTEAPATVVYVESYSANRTDAEIIADQKRDQAKKDALKQERMRQFQELQNQLGME